jgi:hypothetical protein
VNAFIDDNWIQTKVEGPGRTSWAVVRGGQVLHAEELSGDDPSGYVAYQAGLAWAADHLPGVIFHWKHKTYVVGARLAP